MINLGKTFNSWSQIEAYLKKQIDSCLDKEVAQHVKEEQMTAISDVVYGAGIPSKYERRGGNPYGGMGNTLGTGSLGDPSEMHHTVKNGELVVTNDAERNIDYKWAGYGYDTSKSLAENIVYGYGDKDEWYNEPRDFISETIKSMKESGSHVEVMKEALEKRGLEVL